jgi:hypothetical protein
MIGMLAQTLGVATGNEEDDEDDDEEEASSWEEADDDDDDDEGDEGSSDEGQEEESLYGLAQKLANKAMSEDGSEDSYGDHLPDLVDVSGVRKCDTKKCEAPLLAPPPTPPPQPLPSCASWC